MERTKHEPFYLSQQKTSFFQSMLLIRTVMNENHCSAKHTVQLKSVTVSMPAPLEEACHLLPDSQLPHGTQGQPRRKKTTVHLCPKDTCSHLTKASERTRFSCPLGTALFTYHQRPTSANAQDLILQQAFIPEVSGLLGSISFLLGNCHASSITT